MPKKNTFAGSIALIAWRLLEFYGKDPNECFGPSGIDRAQLEDPKTRIAYDVYDDICRCVQRVIDDPCAGLNAVHFWHPATFGVLGYAMLSSSTLRESLERMVRYQQVVAEESQVTLTETAKGLVLQQNYQRYQTGEFSMVVDAGLSIWLHICRFNFGDVLDPVEVNLIRPKPGCAGRYYAFYRCPVNFSQQNNNLILPLEAIDKLLPSANQKIAQMHDHVLQNYLAQQHRSDLTSRVRESIIRHLPSGDDNKSGANKDQVAKDLLMSTRTLHRRLHEEENNFVDILNETRRDLALQYIQDDSLPLQEITYLLGFSEAANFTRAFKRWTGKTPSKFRV